MPCVCVLSARVYVYMPSGCEVRKGCGIPKMWVQRSRFGSSAGAASPTKCWAFPAALTVSVLSSSLFFIVFFLLSQTSTSLSPLISSKICVLIISSYTATFLFFKMPFVFCLLWEKAGSALQSVALNCGGRRVSETFVTGTGFLVGEARPPGDRLYTQRIAQMGTGPVVLFSVQALAKHNKEARSIPRSKNVLISTRSLPVFPVPCPFASHTAGAFVCVCQGGRVIDLCYVHCLYCCPGHWDDNWATVFHN